MLMGATVLCLNKKKRLPRINYVSQQHCFGILHQRKHERSDVR